MQATHAPLPQPLRLRSGKHQVRVGRGVAAPAPARTALARIRCHVHAGGALRAQVVGQEHWAHVPQVKAGSAAGVAAAAAHELSQRGGPRGCASPRALEAVAVDAIFHIKVELCKCEKSGEQDSAMKPRKATRLQRSGVAAHRDPTWFAHASSQQARASSRRE